MKIFALDIDHISFERCVYEFGQHQGNIIFETRGDNTGAAYSYIGIDPYVTWQVQGDELTQIKGQATTKIVENFADFFKKNLPLWALEKIDSLPSFQTGLAGYISYDYGLDFEKIVPPQKNDLGFPKVILGYYDLILAYDHGQKKAHILSSGPFDVEEQERRRIAFERAHKLKNQIEKLREPPQKLFPPSLNWQMAYTPPEMEEAIFRIRRHILDGDIFQANMTFYADAKLPKAIKPFDLYWQKRQDSLAPMGGFMNMLGTQILCFSPERFIKITNDHILTSPIKGSRPRHKDPVMDRQYGLELIASDKDFRENVMIVDLMRNDLSKICLPGTVKVRELCQLNRFSHIQHLISHIEGHLRPGTGFMSILKALLPAGSITGAPKPQAMRLINQYEKAPRGPYCGIMGYYSLNGDSDWNILIRSIFIQGDHCRAHAGSGIVADSDVRAERLESLHKLKPLLG